MAAIDNFAGQPNGVCPDLMMPATHVQVTTGDDSTDLTYVSRAILVATAGNIKVTTLGGETAVVPFPAGQTSLRVTRIWSTSTTAVGITALS